MGLVDSLLDYLGSEDSEGRPDPPSGEDDATTVAEPSNGWKLDLDAGHGTGHPDRAGVVESTGNWPIGRAMEPATEPELWYHAAPPVLRGEGYVLGVDPRTGRAKKLLGEQRNHSYVLGKSGTAKTTFLLSQMLQDVEAGESVVVLDPHADLARKLLSHVPKERWDDVVYINPLTAKRWRRVVKLNFLEHVPEAGRELAKRAFMSALKKIHPNAWGYRMESIMRYALNLVYADMEFPTLRDLLDAIGNRNGKREDMLRSTRVDAETQDFWNQDYKDFDERYKISAQDKIYKLVSENDLKPMTNARRTGVSLFEAMNQGKIVVVDFPEGRLTGDLTSYLGSLVLMRIYQAASARVNVPESEREPVHLYIDEAHRFMSEIIQDNMRTLRKFGVFVTGASQSLQEYGEAMGTEVQELADTLIAFKCGERTARRISASFPALGRSEGREAWNAIVDLPYYRFYVSTPVGGVTEVRLVETVDVGRGPADWREVARTSVDRYGAPVRRRRKLSIPSPEGFKPAELFVLSALAEERKKKESSEPPEKDDAVDWRLSKKNLYGLMEERYGIDGDQTYEAGKELTRRHYIAYDYLKKKADGSEAKTSQMFFYITRQGLEEIYPPVRGPRAGSATHVTMLCQLLKRYRLEDSFPMAVTGEKEGVSSDEIEYYPDLLVFPPYRVHDGGYSPAMWDPQSVFAVEAEAFPTGSRKGDVEEGRSPGTGSHLDRTAQHFETMRDRLELPAVFAARNGRDAEAVKEALKDAGANVWDGNPAEMEAGGAKVIQVSGSLPTDDEWLQRQVRDSTKPMREKTRPGEKGGLKGGGGEKIKQLEEEPSGQDVPKELEARKGEGEGRAEAESPERWRSLCGRLEQGVESRRPPEKLAETVRLLKDEGCKFGLNRSGGHRYLQVMVYEDNDRSTESVCRINDDVAEALRLAGVQVKGLTESSRPVDLPDHEKRLRKMGWKGLVDELKSRKKEGKPPGKLAVVLWEMKERKCRFLPVKSGEREYLYTYRKGKSSDRESCGHITRDVGKALEMAEIDI